MRKTRVLLSVFCLSAFLVFCLAAGVWANPVKAPEKIKVVMVGDRLVDISRSLGVLPEAMSVRCSTWPMCKELRLASQVLGCPKCIVTKKPKALPNYMKQHGITRLILEKNDNFCLYRNINPAGTAKLVRDLPGVQVEYVDFNKGLIPAIEQTAKLLGKEVQARQVIASYNERMAKVEKSIPKQKLGLRVLILNGVYSDATGKTFIRVEAPGGYTDQYILEPLGCTNAGAPMVGDESRISKGHAMTARLRGMAEANPDVIVLTGDAFAVQLALRAAQEKNPDLSKIPALANGAVYSLPLYTDSSVLEYPEVFTRWATALKQ